MSGESGRGPEWADPVAEILFSRDAILEAVGFAAERLLRSASWEQVLPDVVERLGKGAGASRCYVYRNIEAPDGALLMDEIAEWTAPGITGTMQFEDNHGFAYAPDHSHYVRELSRGKPMLLRASTAGPVDLRDLEDEDIRSTAFLPVLVGPDWWGFLGFDDCAEERVWSATEVDALQVAATMLGAAISREASDRARLEAEQLYRALVEQIPAVTYVEAVEAPESPAYSTRFLSPQIEDLVGYTPEELIGDASLWEQIVHPDDRDAFLSEEVPMDGSEGRFEAEYRLVAKDGRTVWVHDEAAMLHLGDQEIWHGVIYDITALRAALEHEQGVSGRLAQLDEMKNTFLNAVSHDLRTPVSAILGLALTLERGDSSLGEDEKREFASRIGANARKLNRIVADLLDMDRLSRGAAGVEPESVDVGDLVRRVLDGAEVAASHPVSVDVAHVVAEIDPAKVERIVDNLLANAAKHTSPGTRVHVRVRPEEGGVLIMVEDEGPGVPEELRDSVFEPFKQGSDSRTLGGVGVGLSVVDRFAELHGGRAWVEERDGGGASFRVFLPSAAVPR